MPAARKNKKSAAEKKAVARAFNKHTANTRLPAPFVPNVKGIHVEKGKFVENHA